VTSNSKLNPSLISETQEKEETSQKELPLEIRGKWLRFKEYLPFAKRRYVTNQAPCCLIAGIRGTGKSSLAENLGTHFVNPDLPPEKTGKILDFFGSRDNEGLAWCRSPYSDSILFVCGNTVDISSSWDYKRFKELKLSDFRKYKIILTCSAFFSSLREENIFMKEITDKLRHRTHWNRPWAFIIREAANLIYSRISLGENQAQAKAYFIYMIREARHSGLAVIADAIRFKGVDVDLRSIADYTFIKAVGYHGLPKELSFLYGRFVPTSVSKFGPEKFILITKSGSIARGYFEYPWWHKTEREDLLKEFDIQVDYGEPINYGDKGWKTVSDFEHKEFIITRATVKNKYGRKISIGDIARQFNRSNATVGKHVLRHNREVREYGECSICKRVRCEFSKTQV